MSFERFFQHGPITTDPDATSSGCFMQHAPATDCSEPCTRGCAAANKACASVVNCQKYCCSSGPYVPPSGGGGNSGGGTSTSSIMRKFADCSASSDRGSAKCIHTIQDCMETSFNNDASDWSTNYCENLGTWPECSDTHCQLMDHSAHGGRFPGGGGGSSGGGSKKPVGPKIKTGGRKGSPSHQEFIDTTAGKVTIGIGIVIIIVLLSLVIKKNFTGRSKYI